MMKKKSEIEIYMNHHVLYKASVFVFVFFRPSGHLILGESLCVRKARRTSKPP